MKQISGETAKRKEATIIWTSGDFCYRMDVDWAKFPDELRGIHVLSACWVNEVLYTTTDDPLHPIIKFSRNGDYLGEMGHGLFQKAHGIALTPRGTLLCADSSTHAHWIRELSMEGELLREFGTPGVPGDSGYDPAFFDHIPALSVRLDSIKKAGTPFTIPCKMIQLETGDMFAADGYGNAAIHHFAADGTLIKTWGGPGREDGKFRLPHAIWADRVGRIWVADRENNRVQIFTQDGELIAVVKDGMFNPADVWSDDKNIYIGELNGGITIMDYDLQIVAQIGYRASPFHAHGICGDEFGNLYILTNKNSPVNNLIKLTRLP